MKSNKLIYNFNFFYHFHMNDMSQSKNSLLKRKNSLILF